MQAPLALAAPGAGIPAIERMIGKFIIFHFRLRKKIDVPALRAAYQQSLQTLIATAEHFPEPTRTTPILIPRLRGLEDSSRFYSPAMVLEHIALVDNGVSQIVRALGTGAPPPPAPGTADVKPHAATPWQQAITMAHDAAHHYTDSLNVDFTQTATLPHPWFGPLNAWQWAQFIPIHHAIHLNQLQTMLSLSDAHKN